MESRVPGWFRWVLKFGAASSWVTLLAALAHKSGAPEVLGRYSVTYFSFVVLAFLVTLVATVISVGSIPRWVYQKRFHVLLSFGSLTISLVVIEAAVRIFDPLGVSYYAEMLHAHSRAVPDDLLVYKNRPNSSGVFFGAEISFNELGLRSSPLGEKRAGEFRILVLGDSVTFGTGVITADTFCIKLEYQLNDKMNGDFRVINSGVGSYNTVQQKDFFKRHVDSIRPDPVILVYVANDIVVTKGPYDPHSGRSLKGRSLVNKIAILATESWVIRIISHNLRFARGREEEVNRDSKGWRDSMEAIGRISDICSDREVPFVTFPYRTHRSTVTDALWEDIGELARIRGIFVADFLPWFDDVDFNTIRNSWADSHLNAKGQVIMANGIERFLVEQNLLK